jgi:signal transduction histidine kinase
VTDVRADLARENEKLRKINRVLIERVERSTDAQGNAFTLFQAAITLEKMVQNRTVELKALNAQLREAKIEAERANLSKTKFFAAASHDLQQPLNIARLYLNALGERERDPDALRMVERIAGALDGADNLLATLLEMARFDASATVPDTSDFAIDTLLRAIANDYALQAEERHLRLRVVPCDAIVRTDPRLLDRILRNFVSNALRYTIDGGVLIGCRSRSGRLRIEVWDTGYGIPENRQAEIFEEFRQLDVPERETRGMGLGLGLAIVERIAKLLDLHVGLRSRVGRGSVFTIDVPLGERERVVVPVRAAAPKRRASGPLFGKTVLLVDDDADALDGMAVLLRTWGCRTIEARSVTSAVEQSQSALAAPDLIVADFHLGHEHTGLDAIDRVRAIVDRQVAAVVLTADRSAAIKARVEAGGHWFLEKPVRIERLRSLMSFALG